MESIIIRKMSGGDLHQVCSIEQECFTTPWSMSSFQYELRNSESILKVALYNSLVIGYVCLRTILEVTHVLNLAVLPEFRRMGIGSRLFREALAELKSSGAQTSLAILEVRESNTAAINLYTKFGFSIEGRRKGYYQKPHEDAVLMSMEI